MFNFDFERQRIQLELSQLIDKSSKGSIDDPIKIFLKLINQQPDCISTSSCSGRLVTYQSTTLNRKRAGSWLFVSHHILNQNQLQDPINTLFGNHLVDLNPSTINWNTHSSTLVHLIYQPPVLHLLARSVQVATPILTSAIGAGFRNSGITVGHGGRVILAIRSTTGGLDVPIAIKKSDSKIIHNQTSFNLQLLVPLEYLSKLLSQGNQLMHQNQAKLQRLYQALSASFSNPTVSPNKNIPWESYQDRRQRMKLEGLARRATASSQSSTLKNSSTESFDKDDDDLPQLSLLE